MTRPHIPVLRWAPFLLSVVIALASAAGVWTALTARVAAAEVRVDERRGDIEQIRQDIREIRHLLEGGCRQK